MVKVTYSPEYVGTPPSLARAAPPRAAPPVASLGVAKPTVGNRRDVQVRVDIIGHARNTM